MFLDNRSAYFREYRDQAAIVVVPLQIAVDVPVKTVKWLITVITDQKKLLIDNAKLRQNQLVLETKLHRVLALEEENSQLRDLLQSTPQIGGKMVAAQLLAVDLDPDLHQLIVDKGKKNNVYVGQPVFDAYGVLGQIINVGEYTSRVLLLTDTRSAVPVQDYRTGVRAIAIGLGDSGELQVINVPETADVKKGDLFVSSGLGLRFPMGYPVGVVQIFERIPGERFSKIILEPAAHLSESQHVLLVWPDKAALNAEVQALLQKPVPTVSGEEQKDEK